MYAWVWFHYIIHRIYIYNYFCLYMFTFPVFSSLNLRCQVAAISMWEWRTFRICSRWKFVITLKTFPSLPRGFKLAFHVLNVTWYRQISDSHSYPGHVRCVSNIDLSGDIDTKAHLEEVGWLPGAAMGSWSVSHVSNPVGSARAIYTSCD